MPDHERDVLTEESVHPSVHGSTITIAECRKQLCAHQRMSGSKNMVHLHNGILLSREKEGAYTLCNSMDGTGEHYAK